MVLEKKKLLEEAKIKKKMEAIQKKDSLLVWHNNSTLQYSMSTYRYCFEGTRKEERKGRDGPGPTYAEEMVLSSCNYVAAGQYQEDIGGSLLFPFFQAA
jgi:hypothetical protein